MESCWCIGSNSQHTLLRREVQLDTLFLLLSISLNPIQLGSGLAFQRSPNLSSYIPPIAQWERHLINVLKNCVKGLTIYTSHCSTFRESLGSRVTLLILYPGITGPVVKG